MDTTIRRARRGDLPELARLCAAHARYERADTPPEGFAERLMDLLEDPDSRVWCWVVDTGDGLAGYLTCSREFGLRDNGDYVHMDCLYLDPDHRGSGIGADLLRRVRADARELGIAVARWQTPDWNTGAVRFYEREGARGEVVTQYTVAPLDPA